MDLVIGSLIGATAVGLNRTAWRTNELILSGTINPFNVVALQTLSRLQSDSAELIKAYRWMVSKSTMLSCPALVGLGVLAPEGIPIIYGEKWEMAGVLVQIMKDSGLKQLIPDRGRRFRMTDWLTRSFIHRARVRSRA